MVVSLPAVSYPIGRLAKLALGHRHHPRPAPPLRDWRDSISDTSCAGVLVKMGLWDLYHSEQGSLIDPQLIKGIVSQICVSLMVHMLFKQAAALCGRGTLLFRPSLVVAYSGSSFLTIGYPGISTTPAAEFHGSGPSFPWQQRGTSPSCASDSSKRPFGVVPAVSVFNYAYTLLHRKHQKTLSSLVSSYMMHQP